MAGVFLSYDRSDRAKAASITAALENAGHSVWWDQQIRGGAQYSKEIEQALGDADAVVVLWSGASVDSAWVRDEAAAGRDSGRLIPVLIDPCTPPMGFRQYQTIDLTRSKGRARTVALGELVSAVEALSGETPKTIAEPASERPPGASKPKRKSIFAGGAALAAAAMAGGVFVWSGAHHSSAPVVAVQAADSSPRSTALARGLLVNLGNIQPSGNDLPELVDGSSAAKADFIFEVADSSGSAGHSESLLLLRGDNRQVLASRDFAAPAPTAASDQLAARAALLLGCATEAAGLDGKRLALVKEYINTCDQFPDYFAVSDIALLVPSLRSIVAEVRDFRPAVEKLLLAESVGFLVPDEWEKDAPAMLRRHIALGREIDSEMPEADIAEATLLPLNAFGERLRLMDRAVANAPENASVLAAR
jgi:hypothetical protein